MELGDDPPPRVGGGHATLLAHNRPVSSVDGMSRRSLVWVLAALLGIALTAGITWASSQLTSQRIGLSAEPISAGVRLAPPVNTTTRRVVTLPSRTSTTTTTLTVTAATPTQAPPQAAPQTTAPSTRPGEDGTQRRSDSRGNAGAGAGAGARGRDD